MFLFNVCTLLVARIYYFPLSSWRYYFLIYFSLKFSISERHGQTCSLFFIQDQIKLLFFDKSCTVQIIWQETFGTWRKIFTLKGIKFPSTWCSWIFDLAYDSWYTKIIKLTNELFPSNWYRTQDWHIPCVLLHLYIHGIHNVPYQAPNACPFFIQE